MDMMVMPQIIVDAPIPLVRSGYVDIFHHPGQLFIFQSPGAKLAG
jgi:hypothetical protein